MSIAEIVVRNWQSLRDVTLAPGRLTVVVGASSSGKSALVRAIRAVSSGVRGSGHITRGAKTCAITVRTDTHLVTLERSATSGLYRIIDLATGVEDTYTKLAGAIPEAVTAALRLTPAQTGTAALNIAAQFDPPFLLDDTGAAVARTLGELTHAHLLLEAVRAAHKARLALSATLRTKTVDLDTATSRLRDYTDLPEQLARQDAAEATAARAATLQATIARLTEAIRAVEDATTTLATAVPPSTPDIAALDAVYADYADYTAQLHTWIATARDAQTTAHHLQQAHTAAEAAHTELHDALTAAGTCPTCGQPTRNQQPT